MTAVDVTSQVVNACVITRLSLQVDGSLRYEAARPEVPPFGADAAQVLRIHLSPGTHSLGIAASAECKNAGTSAELSGDPVVLTLRDARSFLVGKGPATLALHLKTAPADPWQLDAEVGIQGGELGPAIGHNGPLELAGSVDGDGVDARHCRALEAAPRTICRTEAALAQARANKDVVRVNCVNDKLTQIRTYATILERARQRSATAIPGGPEEDAAEDAHIIQSAEEKVRALEVEVTYCVGSEVLRLGPGE